MQQQLAELTDYPVVQLVANHKTRASSMPTCRKHGCMSGALQQGGCPAVPRPRSDVARSQLGLSMPEEVASEELASADGPTNSDPCSH
jgi:hypothetical protein